jgi:sulfite oxidase
MVITLKNTGDQAEFPTREDGPRFSEEKLGYGGYVEWEKYPEKKKQAAEVLSRYKFPGPPEFQLNPLPRANPVLEGVRWKQYHYAMGKVQEFAIK